MSMQRLIQSKLVIAIVVLAAAALAGGAYAATQDSGSKARQAVIGDAAKRLNVSPAQLRSALIAAFEDQLNAAVKAGRLTQAQANAIKRRIEQSGLPPMFGPSHHGFFGRPVPGSGGPRRIVRDAAHYLGMTPGQLVSQLRSGKSLAQIAGAHGRSSSGLEQAITTSVKLRLDQAVASHRITSAQEQRILSRLHDRLGTLMTRSLKFAHPAMRPGAPGAGGGPPWGPMPPPAGAHPGDYIPPPPPGGPFA